LGDNYNETFYRVSFLKPNQRSSRIVILNCNFIITVIIIILTVVIMTAESVPYRY